MSTNTTATTIPAINPASVDEPPDSSSGSFMIWVGSVSFEIIVVEAVLYISSGAGSIAKNSEQSSADSCVSQRVMAKRKQNNL